MRACGMCVYADPPTATPSRRHTESPPHRVAATPGASTRPRRNQLLHLEALALGCLLRRHGIHALRHLECSSCARMRTVRTIGGSADAATCACAHSDARHGGGAGPEHHDPSYSAGDETLGRRNLPGGEQTWDQTKSTICWSASPRAGASSAPCGWSSSSAASGCSHDSDGSGPRPSPRRGTYGASRRPGVPSTPWPSSSSSPAEAGQAPASRGTPSPWSRCGRVDRVLRPRSLLAAAGAAGCRRAPRTDRGFGGRAEARTRTPTPGPRAFPNLGSPAPAPGSPDGSGAFERWPTPSRCRRGLRTRPRRTRRARRSG